MPFGISTAPEEFQRRLECLERTQRCISCGRRHTDIWKNQVEHDDNFRTFLKRARDWIETEQEEV